MHHTPPLCGVSHIGEEGKYKPLLFINSQIYPHEFSIEPGEGGVPNFVTAVGVAPSPLPYPVMLRGVTRE